MNDKDTLPISEARKKIFDLAENVQKPGSQFTLTERGKPKAVLLSAHEFDSMQETLEVMRIFPDLDKDIKEFKRDLKSGAYKKYSSLEDILKKEGYVVAEKPRKRHAISNRAKTKRSKTARKTSR